MANQYLKLDPIDDDPLQVHGGEGGQVKPKQKWPVTTTTLAGLNNKSLAKELWDALGNDKKAAGVNDSNFASAVNMVMGLSTKVSIGDKTYWFIKKKPPLLKKNSAMIAKIHQKLMANTIQTTSLKKFLIFSTK